MKQIIIATLLIVFTLPVYADHKHESEILKKRHYNYEKQKRIRKSLRRELNNGFILHLDNGLRCLVTTKNGYLTCDWSGYVRNYRRFLK